MHAILLSDTVADEPFDSDCCSCVLALHVLCVPSLLLLWPLFFPFMAADAAVSTAMVWTWLRCWRWSMLGYIQREISFLFSQLVCLLVSRSPKSLANEVDSLDTGIGAVPTGAVLKLL